MTKTRRSSGQTVIGDLTRDLYEAAAAVRGVGETLAQGAGQTLARWQILYLLSERPQTVPAVARRLGLARQNVQRVVDELLKAKLVHQTNNPEHKTSSLHSLTEDGSVLLDRINLGAGRWHQKVLRQLTLDEIRQGREFLKRLTLLARPE